MNNIDPTIYIVIGILCALVSVSSAVITGIQQHRRLRAEENRLKKVIEKHTQPAPPTVTTSSQSSIQMKELDASKQQLQHV